MELNSESSEEQLRAHQARAEAEQAIVELTANLLRIVRGAGKPYEIGRQARALVVAMQEHWDSVRMWPYGEMASAIQIPNVRWDGDDPDTMRQMAERQMLSGALQLVASEMLGQRAQEAAGRSELYDGYNAMAEYRLERQRMRAAADAGARAGKQIAATRQKSKQKRTPRA